MDKDTSKMTAAELHELASSLMLQAEAQRTREFESTMNFLSDKLRHMGKTKRDAVVHLVKMMRTVEVQETLAELAQDSKPRTKERMDLDSHGKAPELGVVYKLPTGERWEKRSKVGATSRKFADHAKSTTWAEMAR